MVTDDNAREGLTRGAVFPNVNQPTGHMSRLEPSESIRPSQQHISFGYRGFPVVHQLFGHIWGTIGRFSRPKPNPPEGEFAHYG